MDVPKYSSQPFSSTLKLGDKKPIILLITQPLVEDGLWKPYFKELTFKTIVNAVSSVNGQLIVKVHPRESLTAYKNFVNNKGKIKIHMTKDYDLHYLLLSSDIVLTVCSTVGLWAIAYKKPLLVLNCFHLPLKNVLCDMAISIKNLETLSSTLKEILFDEKKKTNLIDLQTVSLHDHLYYLDGRASERIANLILYVLKNNMRISEPLRNFAKIFQ